MMMMMMTILNTNIFFALTFCLTKILFVFANSKTNQTFESRNSLRTPKRRAWSPRPLRTRGDLSTALRLSTLRSVPTHQRRPWCERCCDRTRTRRISPANTSPESSTRNNTLRSSSRNPWVTLTKNRAKLALVQLSRRRKRCETKERNQTTPTRWTTPLELASTKVFGTSVKSSVLKPRRLNRSRTINKSPSIPVNNKTNNKRPGKTTRRSKSQSRDNPLSTSAWKLDAKCCNTCDNTWNIPNRV